MNKEEQLLYQKIKSAVLEAEYYKREAGKISPVLNALLSGIRCTALGREVFIALDKDRRNGTVTKKVTAQHSGALLELSGKDLKRMKLSDLQQYVEVIGVPGSEKMKKAQCIEIINNELSF